MCLYITMFLYFPDVVVRYVVDNGCSIGSGGGFGGWDDSFFVFVVV